jgi:hypothetical protein
MVPLALKMVAPGFESVCNVMMALPSGIEPLSPP